jgi:PAS domain S-box-containing protein
VRYPRRIPKFAKIGDLRDAHPRFQAQNQKDMMRTALPEGVTNIAGTDLDVGVLFDRLLDAVIIARLSTARIELWNPAAEKLFGFSAHEAIGQSIEIIMPVAIANVHRIGYERYLRTGHGLIIDAGAPVEMPARTKSGEDIRIELSLSQLQNAHGERFALAVIRDAMNHKRLELTNLELTQARVARSEAEAAVTARDELLDGVTATLQAAPDLDELQRLTTALSDIRRLHTGQLTVSPEDGDLVDIATAAVEGARRHARGRRIRFNTPPRMPATFDAPRTRQILEQVLDEAWHRTPDGSRLDIRLENLSPRIVQVNIAAPGTGSDRGVGIGLHLSRELMHRQNGTFTVAMSANGGIDVVMTLPAPSPSAPLRRQKRRLASSVGGGHRGRF